MELFNKKTPWEKEWADLRKKEENFAKKRQQGPTSVLINKLDRFVPEKLSSTLNMAFFKGFELIFEKGTGIIEKTYNKEKRQTEFKVNTYANELRSDKKSVKSFTKQARSSKATNLLISSVEGIGLGLVGAGIPDIPLFIAMVLKSVYEVALSFGYDYESDAEEIFILRIIKAAMSDEEDFIEEDRMVNGLIATISEDKTILEKLAYEKTEQMRKTSEALSKEMIYTKFLQGQFLVGIAGGLFDPIYVNRISNYAVLKYKRRFLTGKVSSRPSSL